MLEDQTFGGPRKSADKISAIVAEIDLIMKSWITFLSWEIWNVSEKSNTLSKCIVHARQYEFFFDK